MFKIRSGIFYFCFFIFTQVYCQPVKLHTDSKKAIQYYNQATLQYNNYNFEETLKLLNKAIDKDSNFIECYLLKAEIFNRFSESQNEINAYTKVINIDPNVFEYSYFNLAKAQLKLGKYYKAKSNFKIFIDNHANNPKYVIKAQNLIKNCDFAIYQIEHPSLISPTNLGDSINTRFDEYWPSLSADENTLVFTRLIPRPGANISNKNFKNYQEDIFISNKNETTWRKAVNAGRNINSSGNEGTQSMSVDGKFYLFTACDWPDSFGGCDLYYVQKEKDGWSVPVNLGSTINTRYKETQPSLSSDKSVLYFISNRPGGKGKQDIWMSKINITGNWSNPINLGDSINTSGNESSPFIHPDGKSFYFASDGRMGMGGFDIYKAIYLNNTFTSPINLGFPINTFRDEKGIFINANGNIAYYSATSENQSDLDIFYFELPEKDKPQNVNYVSGIVADINTHQKLRAKIELLDLINDTIVNTTTSDANDGTYLFCIPPGVNYALNVSKKGYLFYSDHFLIENSQESIQNIVLNIFLQPIEVGSKAILKNIFYDIDAYKLKETSFTELNKLIDFLNFNPGVEIEISGHTDYTGRVEYNLQLSENRAKSVYEYLVNNNIEESRIKYIGFGSSKPIAENNTKEGRAKNRRTEITIINK